MDPRDEVARLRDKYAMLPKLSHADRSERVTTLEALCEALSRENMMLRKSTTPLPHSSVTLLAPRSEEPKLSWRPLRAPPPPLHVDVATKGTLFSHPESVNAAIVTECPRVQWTQVEFCAGQQQGSTTPRVLCFRVGSRVSPSELAAIANFCVGASLYFEQR